MNRFRLAVQKLATNQTTYKISIAYLIKCLKFSFQDWAPGTAKFWNNSKILFLLERTEQLTEHLSFAHATSFTDIDDVTIDVCVKQFNVGRRKNFAVPRC